MTSEFKLDRPPWVPQPRWDTLVAQAIADADKDSRSASSDPAGRFMRRAGTVSMFTGVVATAVALFADAGIAAATLFASLIPAGVLAIRSGRVRSPHFEALVRNRVDAALDRYKREQLGSADFYHCEAWLALRRTIFDGNNLRCARCGRKGSAMLVIDHIRSRNEAPELALESSNIEILCHACKSEKSAKAAGMAP